ncbi:MAG TPA: NYN domain-containing protein [Acidimicrobiales bacterium]|nr:NYN domain-containing protein [Acidimicrobiales bacterium]
MSTAVYVDGFNLYYGSLRRKSGCRWLDLDALCKNLLPTHDIQLIRYFTARVDGTSDPQAPLRQDIYLRALRTIPHLEIHYGQFTTHKVWMKKVNPAAGTPKKEFVFKTEEKGSDVNLASQLLHDGFKKRCTTAVVISNDSDLVEPIKIARYELGMTVGILNPHPKKSRSWVLSREANFLKQIREGAILASQFADPLHDATGTFYKPSSW